MPLGYNTLLANRGAIARAVARKPQILILDEATSHLDALTEQQVTANLAALGCTCVAIAHRISTVKDADLILVLDEGSIREQGTHDELLSLGGLYAALVAASDDGAIPAAMREDSVSRAFFPRAYR